MSPHPDHARYEEAVNLVLQVEPYSPAWFLGMEWVSAIWADLYGDAKFVLVD